MLMFDIIIKINLIIFELGRAGFLGCFRTLISEFSVICIKNENFWAQPYIYTHNQISGDEAQE